MRQKSLRKKPVYKKLLCGNKHSEHSVCIVEISNGIVFILFIPVNIFTYCELVVFFCSSVYSLYILRFHIQIQYIYLHGHKYIIFAKVKCVCFNFVIRQRVPVTYSSRSGVVVIRHRVPVTYSSRSGVVVIRHRVPVTYSSRSGVVVIRHRVPVTYSSRSGVVVIRHRVPVTYSSGSGVVVASETRVDCSLVGVYTSGFYCNWFRHIDSIVTVLVHED